VFGVTILTDNNMIIADKTIAEIAASNKNPVILQITNETTTSTTTNMGVTSHIKLLELLDHIKLLVRK
jgi:hypothetical protein